MIPRFASVLVASAMFSVVLAQTPAGKGSTVAAPPEVEEALRARVNEFFQYHVDRGPALRKAMDLVAEDTKDEYYAAGKMEIKQFKITDIKFEEGLQKATVILDVTRPWIFGTFAEEVTLPMTTAWKIEEGKWVWYKDRSQVALTPMGVSDLDAAKRAAAAQAGQAPGGVNLADLGDPEKLKQQAQAILGKAGLERDSVTFTLGQAGEDKLVYRNNYLGSVLLDLYDSVEEIPGLTLSLSKKALGPNDAAEVLIRYNPPTEQAAQQAEAAPPKALEKTVRLSIQPFNRELPIRIRIAPAEAGAQPAANQ